MLAPCVRLHGQEAIYKKDSTGEDSVMSFLIDDTLLRRLAEVNSFPVPENEMVFFGLRGALPLNPDDCDFDAARALNVATSAWPSTCASAVTGH